MFIQFKSGLAGHDFNFDPGDVVEWLNEAEAAELCKRGTTKELTPDGAKRAAENAGIPLGRHPANNAAPAPGTSSDKRERWAGEWRAKLEKDFPDLIGRMRCLAFQCANEFHWQRCRESWTDLNKAKESRSETYRQARERME